ncbi:MAG TPA: urease accessory protein UreD [Planctomycetaceae bacterium]|nr:urease accessory protein UreD [Planctomycetaceae bacterium]
MSHVVNGVSPLSLPLGSFRDERLHRNLRLGEGLLQVTRRGDISAIVRSAATNPMRLFIPRRKSPVPHVYTSSYGGGLLAGDQTDLLVQLDEGSRCVLSSQASTKIYKNPRGLPCSQTMQARIGRAATLVLVPEPISCFAGSRYDQIQRFDIAATGNLVLVDWVSSGRYAVGERFQFTHYQSRQSIYYDDQLVIEDAVRLVPAEGPLESKFRLGHYNCSGLMIILGEQFQTLGEQLLAREREQSLQQGGDVLTVTQPLPHGIPGVLMRVLSVETQDAKRCFEGLLRHIDPILGTRSWVGKF